MVPPKRMDFLAITSPGLESILQQELRAAGIEPRRRIPGGVEASGTIEQIWKANLWCRTANRVIARVSEFHASSFHELERRAKKIDWARHVRKNARVAFRVTCRKSRLYHSEAVAERFENVIARELDAEIADRSGDEESNGDAQLFIVRMADDVCTVSIDSSGDLLHRRGYRQAVAKAPLRETLAAAMVIGSGWDRKSPLIDPMCGSGTIAIEAAMMARNIAPGVTREFAFQKWPGHDAMRWNLLVEEAVASEKDAVHARIVASDRDEGAVGAAKANAERAGVFRDMEIEQRSLSAVEIPDQPGFMVTNPPYGMRIGERAPLRNLYARLGRIITDRASGYVLAVLSADRKLEAQLGLELREVFRTTNGGIPVRLLTGRKK